MDGAGSQRPGEQMADLFLELLPDERREALVVAAAASGRPLHLLDKDVWVVWILDVLFRCPFASHIVFKEARRCSQGVPDHLRFSEDCGSDL